MIELSANIRGKFLDDSSCNDAFGKVLALDGEIYRAKEGRRTLRFDYCGRAYFAKIHTGIGWREVFKNLSSFRMPITNASNEWKAVKVLENKGVDTVKIVGKGLRGWNPAHIESFVIMEALDELVEVEDFLKDMGGLKGSARMILRRKILCKVADAARRMHAAGMNHRDFYLCHFHILGRDWSDWTPDEDFKLPLIDLHRAQIRSAVPRRWLVKDLGALLFSAIDCDISDRDIVSFLREYLGPDWRIQISQQPRLWSSVLSRAGKFYQRHRGKPMTLPGVFCSQMS